MMYKDRAEAGKILAQKLLPYKGENPVVVALPRGGVVLGFEIAQVLKAPLDIIVARKIGAPFQPELGVGAIAPNEITLLNHDLINALKISEIQIEKVIEREKIEMNRRIELYREVLPEINLNQKCLIIVDDGIATGISDMAAVFALKKFKPKKIILAVPVCPPDIEENFRKIVDKFICLMKPDNFYAVGAHYQNFEQVSDKEVIELLEKANRNFLK